MESTQQATLSGLFPRKHRHYKEEEGGAEGPEGKGTSRLLNRGARQPRLPLRATPSSRHPLPPLLPVTLRKEECNCSCPSNSRASSSPASSPHPQNHRPSLSPSPTPTPHPSFQRETRVGRISPPPPSLLFPKQRCPYPFADRSGAE